MYQTCLNFRPPHSRSGGHQGPETFLAPSADKQTGEGDIYGVRLKNVVSYKEEALATHYREFHPGTSPSLSFKLLHTERNTIMRKIFEAYIISNLKPNINDKDECIDTKRFLINA